MHQWKYWSDPDNFGFYVIYMGKNGRVYEKLLVGSCDEEVLKKAKIEDDQVIEMYGLAPISVEKL